MKVLILLLLWFATSSACTKDGYLCKKATDCCSNICTPRIGQGAICTKSTSSPTTSTTFPSVTTSAVRFSSCDLGLWYPSPDERKWDPRTGLAANEYLAAVRVEQLVFERLPSVMRALRDIPSCAGKFTSAAISAENEIPGRLLFKYALQRWQPGGTYFFTQADYNWVFPHKQAETLRTCVMTDPVVNSNRPELTPTMLQYLKLGRSHGVLVEDEPTCTVASHASVGTYSYAGAITTSAPGPALTSTQCKKLKDFQAAHHSQGSAVLAHDMATAASLSKTVTSTRDAFESSATSLNQSTLFSLIFTGEIDPKHSQAKVDQLTSSTMGAFDQWVDAFKCGSKQPPDAVDVVNARFKHNRAHFLRAIAGVKLTSICNRLDILSCPSTDQ